MTGLTQGNKSKTKFLVFKLLLVSSILLGFSLRVHDLDGQSMWSDEGLSFYRAEQPIPDILRNTIVVDGITTQDTNPPLYFLLLHFFKSAGGSTVFAMRYMGVLVATFSIPLLYILAKLSFNRRLGLVAAFLIAISPFHVWQSQVLRNYGLLVSLNILSVYALYRFILPAPTGRKSGWLLLWAASSLMGIYTHYFGLFVFAYGLLALAGSALFKRNLSLIFRNRRVRLALGLGSLLLVPALFIAANRFLAEQQFDFYRMPFTQILVHAASAFSVGMYPTLAHPWWRYLPVVALALIGVYFGWRFSRRSTILLVGYQVVPLGLLIALSWVNPLYNGTRHLLFGLPPFLIFLAGGISGAWFLPPDKQPGRFDRLWRWLGPALGIVMVVGQLLWLNVQFTDPKLVRDDIRGVANYLSEQAEPEDLIVLHDTLIQFTFNTYYHGDAPVVAIPKFGEGELKPAIQALQTAAEGKDFVWFLTQPTPRTGFFRQELIDWADDHWPQLFSRAFPALWLRVSLEGYKPEAVVPALPETATEADITWDQTLRLHGFEIPGTMTSGKDWWPIFYLSQPTNNKEQHTLSLRLIDEQGQIWSQMDRVIARGFPPTANQRDQLFQYNHLVQVPPGIPPGQYELWARLIRTADGSTRVTSTGETDVFLSEVNVEAASCSQAVKALQADVVDSTRFGSEIALTGHNSLANPYRPGHLVSMDVWWCALRQPQEAYRLRLQLVDEDGQIVAESIGPLSQADYTPTAWQADELIMGKAELILPATIEAGAYDLRLSVLPEKSDKPVRQGWLPGPRSKSLGTVMVEAWPMQTELPQISRPFEADFGQPPIAALAGYDLTLDEQQTSSEPATLTLYWRSLSDAIASAYTVFVHLVDENGQIIGQGDGPPVSGFRPTTSWRAGEVFEDVHVLTLPGTIPAGSYELWIGLYEPGSDMRLPVYVGGERQANDQLLLEQIEIREQATNS